MIYHLTEKLKLQSGDVLQKLTLRESIKVKDIFAAQREAKTNGALDLDRFTAELIAILCGIAYEDVLEMDVRDFDALDAKLAEIRFPKVNLTPEAKDSSASGSTQPRESRTSS